MVSGVKDETMSIFKTNTAKSYTKLTRANNIYGSGKKLRKLKIKKQSEGNTVKAVRTLFRLKKKIKQSRTE